LDFIDLKHYEGEHVRIGVPDDTGVKSTFNWYGVLAKVYEDRIKLMTDGGQVMFIKLERILEFSTLRNGGRRW